MSPQVSAVLQPLADAIDGLDLPVDNDVLAQAFGLADRLHAKLVAAVGEHDGAEMWRDDGATSMTAWLRHRASHTSRDAALCTKTARRLRQLPVTAAAYRDGVLSGGQVQAIVANLCDRTVGLFAQHEAELVPGFTELSVTETATRMQAWARYAEAILDDPPDKGEPERSLHVSRILDGEPGRSPARRRADALADVCRWFLDHQQERRGGRHRPHVNVVTTLDDLEGRGQGRLIDGTILDGTTVQRLFCDAGVHRVFVAGRSSILDYGTTTCSTPPAGTPNCSPTPPSSSPPPTATPSKADHHHEARVSWFDSPPGPELGGRPLAFGPAPRSPVQTRWAPTPPNAP